MFIDNHLPPTPTTKKKKKKVNSFWFSWRLSILSINPTKATSLSIQLLPNTFGRVNKAWLI